MVARLKICDFVESELNLLRKECNFTDVELEYFNLKAKNKSNTQISFEMHISDATVINISRRVKRKIKKVLN